MAANVKDWAAYTDRLEAAGMAIFENANVTITEKQFADPKVLALTLLCRTLSHMKGMVLVAQVCREHLEMLKRLESTANADQDSSNAKSCFVVTADKNGRIRKGEHRV